MWAETINMGVSTLVELMSGRILQDFATYYSPPPHVEKWLRSPAARAVMKKATLVALKIVGERAHTRAIPLFDEVFLQREDVAAHLASLVLPHAPSENQVAKEVASLWRGYLPHANTEKVPVEELALAFIAAYRRELRGYAPFRVMLDSHDGHDVATAARTFTMLKAGDLSHPQKNELATLLAQVAALVQLLQNGSAPPPVDGEKTPILWSFQLPDLPDPLAEQGVLSQIPLLYTDSAGCWLVTAARDGQIFANEVSGETPALRWRVKLPDGYGGPESLVRWRNHLLVAPQPLQAMDATKDLLLLDEHKGDIVQRIPVPVRQFSPPAVDGDTAYVIGSDGTLYAVDLHTGTVDRLLDRMGSCSPFPSVIHGGKLVAGATAATLSCIDLDSRRMAWQKTAQPGADGTPAYFMASPLVDGNVVYAANWNGSLYAFDLEHGNELWRYPTAGFIPASPVLADDLILVVSKDHRVHAVNRRTGNQCWISADMGRRLYSRPLVLGSGNTATVYAAAFRNQLHALRLSDGKPNWDQPLEVADRVRGDLVAENGRLFVTTRRGHIVAVQAAPPVPLHTVAEWLDLGEWPQAMLQLLRNGEKIHAAALLRDHHFYYRAGKLYEEANDLSSAAEAFARDSVDDSWRRAAVLYRQAGDLAAAARQLERLAEWADAAQAWLEADEKEKAAAIYHKELGESHTAAQLYLQTGKPSMAAGVYAESGDFDAAIAVLEAADARTYRDRIRELRRKAVQATRGDERRKHLSALIAETTDPAEQAALYEEAGEWTLAAQKWNESGQWQRAVDLLVAQDALDSAIDLLQKRTEPQAQHKAAHLLYQQGRWREALHLYQKLNHLEGQALCYVGLNEWTQAARCYEAAAQQATVHRPDAATCTRLADLFAKAAHAYKVGLQARTTQRVLCLQRSRYYRRFPWLTVSFAPEHTGGRFLIDQANVLRLSIENVGAGAARNVRVQLIDVEMPPRIRLAGDDVIDGIAPLSRHIQQVNLYAVTGGSLLVDVHLSWEDPDGVPQTLRLDRWTIPVLDPSKRDGSTPTSMTVEGNVYYTSGGDVIHGNQYRDQAQHRDGDTVEINRNRAASTPPPIGIACPQCGAHNPAAAPFCDGCGERLSAAMPE